MRARLSADGYRFGGLIESIVTSPQFLNKRGQDDPQPAVDSTMSSETLLSLEPARIAEPRNRP